MTEEAANSPGSNAPPTVSAVPDETLELKVKYLERYDRITGLPNREAFIERVQEIVASLPQYGPTKNALLTVDLDDFRRLNDTYGYRVGDELLKLAATKMKTCLRGRDFIGHSSGDEFVILLSEVSTLQDVRGVAERLLSCFADVWNVLDHEFYISASIGIAVFPKDRPEVPDILRNASAALYHAKKKGRSQYQIYQSGTNEKLVHLFELETDLRGALQTDEIVLHYQPQFHAASGMLVGVEALARWYHPLKGVITPGDFVPIAEDSGLIIPMGNRVIELLCAQSARWDTLGYKGLRVAANVSAIQLMRRDFVPFVLGTLDESRMDPCCLELEMTESAYIKSTDKVMAALGNLRKHGIRISIDDFGVGYSSLSYLKSLPVDGIKLDRSFVSEIGRNSTAEAIIMAVILLAQKMGIEIVAEGVETRQQADFLRLNGCTNLQGYLLSKPVDEPSMTEMLSRSHFVAGDADNYMI